MRVIGSSTQVELIQGKTLQLEQLYPEFNCFQVFSFLLSFYIQSKLLLNKRSFGNNQGTQLLLQEVINTIAFSLYELNTV